MWILFCVKVDHVMLPLHEFTIALCRLLSGRASGDEGPQPETGQGLHRRGGAEGPHDMGAATRP